MTSSAEKVTAGLMERNGSLAYHRLYD